MQRERRIFGRGRSRRRILGRREPARLKFADRYRIPVLRLQEPRAELERCPIVFADRVGIALIPVAHRPHRRGRGDLHLVRVDEDRQQRSGNAAHAALEPAEVALQMRCGPGLIVDVGALIVVERDRDDAVGDRRELAQRAHEPAMRVEPVRRVAEPLRGGIVGVRVLQRRGRGVAALEDVVFGHAVRRAFQEPRRIAAVAPFVANHRSGSHDEEEAVVARKREQRAEIAPRVRGAVEIEAAVAGLVPVPGDVEIERVEAQRAERIERGFPAIGRHAFVEEGRAPEEERLAVDEQLRRAGARDDHRMRERRRPGGRGGKEPDEHRENQAAESTHRAQPLA